MDYLKIYNDLVYSRQTRGLNKKNLNFNSERHHIIPRCIGGTNDKNNLVLLTPREHYIAHLLLVKIYPDRHGLHSAVRRLVDVDCFGELSYVSNSRRYQILREKAAQANRDWWTTDDQRVVDIRNRLKARRREYMLEYHENVDPDVKHETIRKIVEANKIAVANRSDEAANAMKEKMSIRAKSREKFECPWCKSYFQPQELSMRHGDKCKKHPSYVMTEKEQIFEDLNVTKHEAIAWQNLISRKAKKGDIIETTKHNVETWLIPFRAKRIRLGRS